MVGQLAVRVFLRRRPMWPRFFGLVTFAHRPRVPLAGSCTTGEGTGILPLLPDGMTDRSRTNRRLLRCRLAPANKQTQERHRDPNYTLDAGWADGGHPGVART